jgi:AAA15 family ATPase/GTPase
MFRVEHIVFYENRIQKVERFERINLIIGSNNSGKTTLLNNIYHELKLLHGHPLDAKWTFGMKLTMNKSGKDVEKVFPNLSSHKQFCDYTEINENLFIRSKKNQDETPPWNENVFELLKNAKRKNYVYEFGAIGNEDRDHKLFSLFSFLVKTMVVYEESVQRLSQSFHTKIEVIENNIPNDFILFLYKNRRVFNTIRDNIREVYKLDIDFDNIPQGLKALRIINKKINKRLTNHFALSNEWNSKSIYLESVGHGIRAYLKLVFSLLDPTSRIVLIDEPETFIHPPQRRALGKFIAKLARQENKQLFIATHDAEFIRGILSSAEEKVKVIRLHKEDKKHFYRAIDTAEISQLLKQNTSILLSERILNSLFYKKTILCENENDRLIYEEAAARYHQDKFHDVNFIGFAGHSETIKFYNRLKDLQIHSAAIVDIDYLRTGSFPASISDDTLKSDFENLQTKLKSFFNKGTPAYGQFKARGLKLFLTKQYKSEYSLISKIINSLSKHDIYVVPAGELESWVGSNDLGLAIKAIRAKKKVSQLSAFMKKVLGT